MVQAIKIVLVIVAVTIGIVSVAMTSAFGWSLTHGWERGVYAASFGAADLAKFMLPTAALYLSARAAFKTRCFYLFLAILSFIAHTGLLLTVKATDVAVANTAQKEVAKAEAEVARIKRLIEPLEKAEPRPLGTLNGLISTAERDPIFTGEDRSNKCTNDTAPASVDFCKAYLNLTGERTNREELDKLNAELKDAQAKVPTGSGGPDSNNVFAETVGKKLGIDSFTVLVVLALIISGMLEGCSSQLLSIAAEMKPRVAVPTPASEPISQPLIDPNASITIEIEPEMAVEPPSELCPKEWVSGRVSARKAVSTPWAAFLDAYRADAEAHGLAPASSNALSRAITDAGFADRTSIKKALMIPGAALRPARTASLSVVSRSSAPPAP
ncbi:hypothetical protein [Rhodomicrobium sp. R_RK_3]|nr:hypothetical protein [Rhodomicrobium sp. R_RK_3]